MTLSLDTAYRSFGGEVEASSTPTICRLPDSRRHQLSAIARAIVTAGSLILAIAAFAPYLPLLLFRSIRLLPLPWRAASGLRVKLLHRECEAKSKEIRCSFA